MIIKKNILLLVVILALQITSNAQNDNANSLYNQFEDLKESSNNYQIYKVVKESSLDDFWRSVRDSIRNNHKEINDLEVELARLNSEVAGLQKDVSERDMDLTNQADAIENITFLGVNMQKSTYSAITWTIILILAIAVLILYFRFKNSNKITINSRREFDSLSNEFDEHRQRTRENETKLKRDLQTEINRVEELKELLGSRNA